MISLLSEYCKFQPWGLFSVSNEFKKVIYIYGKKVLKFILRCSNFPKIVYTISHSILPLKSRPMQGNRVRMNFYFFIKLAYDNSMTVT